MGCAISPILFVMAMEVIWKAAEGSAGPANLGGDCYMLPSESIHGWHHSNLSKWNPNTPNVRAPQRFNVMVQDEFQTKEVSQPLSKKRQKSCGDDVYDKQIPRVSEEPVKSLGRWFDSSMKDTKRGQETAELATEGLLAINRMWSSGHIQSVVSTVHVNP